MFKEISKSDVSVRPFKVHKEWTLDENDIPPIYAINNSGTLVDLDNDPTSQGFNQKVVYASVKSQFYNNPQTASIFSEVGRRKSYTSNDERNLENNIVVLSIPQKYYGEGIKIGSVRLTDDPAGTATVYTDDGYSNLIDSSNNIKGNIFYDRGLVVFAKNVTTNVTLSSFFLNFRGTKTIYETEVFISILENEFNFSQNPSAIYESGASVENVIVNDPNDRTGQTTYTSSIYKPGVKYVRTGQYKFTSSLNPNKFASFDDYLASGSLDPTGSYLAPYITTIGLYDDEMNMVAVAKLPQPVKCLPDYPVNFLVRIDT